MLRALRLGAGQPSLRRLRHLGGVRTTADGAADVRLEVIDESIIRVSADPDGEKAEYAISLRSDMAGQGLGPVLMQRIIDYSRERGIKEIFGTVLRENRPMLRVCERFGFSQHINFDDPGVVEVRLGL